MNEQVVFDTNTLISASLFEKSIPKQAFDKAIQNFQIITADSCFTELKNVIYRPKFSKYINIVEVSDFLNFL